MGFVPSALFELLRAQFALHIVQYMHHHKLARGFHRFQHAVCIGCKQHAGLPQFTFVQLHREQAAAAVTLVGALPIAFEPHQQLSAQIANQVAGVGQF